MWIAMNATSTNRLICSLLGRMAIALHAPPAQSASSLHSSWTTCSRSIATFHCWKLLHPNDATIAWTRNMLTFSIVFSRSWQSIANKCYSIVSNCYFHYFHWSLHSCNPLETPGRRANFWAHSFWPSIGISVTDFHMHCTKQIQSIHHSRMVYSCAPQFWQYSRVFRQLTKRQRSRSPNL